MSAARTGLPHAALVLPVLWPGGAESIVAELARRLPERGFETSVFCLETSRTALGDELRAAGVRVEALQCSRRNTLACAAALRKRLPAVRPLVIHAHLFHANLAARWAWARMNSAARAGACVLNTVHVAERRCRPWQFALDHLTAPWCRAEICVSQAAAKFQQARTGLPEDFFPVVANGIDLARFTPRNASAGAERPLCVVSAGRLDPQKDYPVLLRAWRQVAAALPRVKLKIAGDGPEAAALRALAASLHIEESVEWLGRVADMPGLLRSASLYVQSSAWEGFGLAVAEAMACALPVIVTAADSLPELVAHERTGLVVPVGSADALARSIIALLQDRPRAERLGLAAREHAVSQFSITRMTDEYAGLYRRVLATV